MAPTFSAPSSGPTTHTSGLVLSEFLDRFSDVIEEADGWVVVCPAHADGHPSLRVAVNDDGALLLHCRAGCSKDDVLAALGITKADLFGVRVGAMAPRHTAPAAPLSAVHVAPLSMYLDKAAEALWDRGEDALTYAARRFGITPDIARAIGLGFDDGDVPHPGLGLSATAYRADARLVVPFCGFDGNPIGLQARALSRAARTRWSGPTNPKDGASWSKYGVFRGDNGLPGAEFILTEGPGDALSAVAIGYDSLCIRGASLGSNAALADELAVGLRGRRVIVAGDSDAAGTKFIAAVCEALSSRGVDTYRLRVPAGLSDVTEWREADPASFAARFSEAVKAAEPYGEDQVLADRLQVEATQLLTDVFNAHALLEFFHSRGADVRFTEAVGFLIYQGDDIGVWAPDPKGMAVRAYAQDATPYIQRRVLEKVHSLESRCLDISDPSTRSRVAEAIMRLRGKVTKGALVSWAMSSNGISNMLKELASLPSVYMKFTDFDQHPQHLAAANGVVNLETGELTPFSDETRLMYLTKRVNIAYQKGARNPRWQRFIREVFRDHPELVGYIQRLLGYGITGHTEEQIVSVMLGKGANGKSLLMETVFEMMADYAYAAPFSTFERKDVVSGGPSSDVANLAGRRLVIASEGDKGRQMAEALIKRLSGGDPVTACFKYQNEFTFHPECLLVLISNNPPEFRSRDLGTWRRLRMIPFTRNFNNDPHKDPFLKAKFLGKRVPSSKWLPGDDLGDGVPGILSWLVEGAMEWYRTGLEEPDIISRATQEFKESTDQLGDFLSSKLIADDAATMKGGDMFKLYLEWADEERLQARDQWKRTTFYKAMEERGAVAYTRDGSKWLRGFRALTPREQATGSAHHGDSSVLGELHPGPSPFSPAETA